MAAPPEGTQWAGRSSLHRTDLAPQAFLGVILVVLYERVGFTHGLDTALHSLSSLGLSAEAGRFLGHVLLRAWARLLIWFMGLVGTFAMDVPIFLCVVIFLFLLLLLFCTFIIHLVGNRV